MMIKKPAASVFDGDEFCISRILARQSSVGHSSRVLDPSSCQATVPFGWEMRPGTPKNPQQDQLTPPLSPPPSMHSLGHRLSNIDHVDSEGSTNMKASGVWSLEKAVRKFIKVVLIPSKRRGKQRESSRFGYLSEGEFVSSSFSSCSSSSIPSSGRLDDHLSGLAMDSTVEAAVPCIPGKMSASLVRTARRPA